MISKPASKSAPHSAPSRAPTRRPIVAKRDNQVRRKGQPRDIRKPVTLFDLAAEEPVKAAKRCREKISAATGGYHQEMRRQLAVAYAVARALQKSRHEWRSFINDDFWQNRKRPLTMDDQREPLLHVLVFVFEANDRNVYKRAAKYAAGLKQYWRDNVSSRQIAAKIKEDGGIEALSQASAERGPKKRQKPEQSSKLTFSASAAGTKALLALSEGQEARLTIRRVTGARGVVARILRFIPVKT